MYVSFLTNTKYFLIVKNIVYYLLPQVSFVGRKPLFFIDIHFKQGICTVEPITKIIYQRICQNVVFHNGSFPKMEKINKSKSV